MRSAAATSIDARSAAVRGLRSFISRSTSSMVTVAGSGVVCANNAIGLQNTVSASAVQKRPGLFILHLDRWHPANDEAVRRGQNEQSHGDCGDETADDHDGKRPLC